MRSESKLDMDNCGLEYGVNATLVKLCAAVGIDAIVMNDFTRSDLIVRRKGRPDGCWVGIQLKTTRSHVSKKPSCWQFDNIKGYQSMLVVCVVCNDPNQNWIFSGDYLNTLVPENLCISAGGKYDSAALAHGTIEEIVNHLEVLVDGCLETGSVVTPTTEYAHRTDFLSGGHAKEFRLFELFDQFVAGPKGWETKWPAGASLTYDKLITFDAGRSWHRAQFKSVSPRRATSGMRGKLTKKVHKKTQPYDYDDADLFVFLYCNQEEACMDVWMLSNDMLIEKGRHLNVGNVVEGTGYITLHVPDAMLGAGDAAPFRNKPTGNGGRVSKSLWTENEHMRVQIG